MEQLARLLDPIAAGQADCPVQDCPASLDALHAWHAAVARLPSAARGHLQDAAKVCRACGGTCQVRRIIDSSLSTLEIERLEQNRASASRTATAVPASALSRGTDKDPGAAPAPGVDGGP